VLEICNLFSLVFGLFSLVFYRGLPSAVCSHLFTLAPATYFLPLTLRALLIHPRGHAIMHFFLDFFPVNCYNLTHSISGDVFNGLQTAYTRSSSFRKSSSFGWDPYAIMTTHELRIVSSPPDKVGFFIFGKMR
jgi:hypothetical protein